MVSLTELWAVKSMDDVPEESRVGTLLQSFEKLEVTAEVCKKAGELVRHEYAAGLDAVIVASALMASQIVLTRNVRHFKQVPALEVWSKPGDIRMYE